MNLNIPILEQIPKQASVLITGAGGGYDVFSGLPLFLELEQLGYDVHLANFSFSDVISLYEGEQLSDTLVGVSIDVENIDDYFPEYYLSEWFFNERNEFVTIWCFQKTGARPLIKNYKLLIEHLEIDCIILVDGGIDSLMRGDESQTGTLFEDTLSIVAVEGEYGNFHLIKRTEGNLLHISPLMSIFWFFDLPNVAKNNRLVKALTFTYSVEDAWHKMVTALKVLPERDISIEPLP